MDVNSVLAAVDEGLDDEMVKAFVKLEIKSKFGVFASNKKKS